MKYIISMLTLVTFLSGCSTLFEKSIAEKSIDIYTPADSMSTKQYSQQFYWEKVDGATSYRVQIVKPDFSSIQNFILDTITTSNSITVVLNAGEYEWRLRAQNGGSETKYFSRKIFITETSFNERPMLVKATTSGGITYTKDVSLSWTAVSGAQKYIIEVDSSSGNFVNPTSTTIGGSLVSGTFSLNKRGVYNWRMYADSAGIKSMYSSTGTVTFKLDTADLSMPVNNDKNVFFNADFKWEKPSNGLSSDQYTYELYLLNSADEKDLASVSGYTFPITDITALIYPVKGLTKGKTYYWGIKVVDQYHVKSGLTAKRKFTVSN